MCLAYVVMPLVALLNRLKRPAQARKSGAMMECPLGEGLAKGFFGARWA